uniref:Xylulose kinase-1 n=1 Tax=Tanacetum cinerariifolium TaxID=118510 RepID=A0A699GHK6_TANCI|nr:hypothetical protein [Tanacetum cinerariifolium]
MVALKYKDEHNKVGYLLKLTGSDDYHHIIDFLRTSDIRYALTHNPIIFDSLVKQFWFTATLRAPKLGEGVEVAAQAVPQPMPAPDQPLAHLSPPSTQQTSDPIAPVFEHGKLVKKVKALEVKLKIEKRKMVVSDSDQEADGHQDVDLDALRALANAALIVDSDIPSDVLLGTFYVLPAQITDVSSSAAPAGVSSKGKSPMVEEDIPIKARTFKHMEEDRLEVQRKRQQDVLDSAMYYNEADWLNIRAQSSAIYNTGWTMAYVKSFTDDQLKQEFEKICKVQSNSQIQAFSRTLKQPGPVLEEPSSKRQQSTEAPIPPVPEVPLSSAVSSPLSSRIRRKSLGQKHILKPKSTLPKLDLAANAQTFIKVVVNEDSDDEATLD